MAFNWISVREGSPEIKKPYLIRCLLEDGTYSFGVGVYNGKEWLDQRGEGVPMYWSPDEYSVTYIPGNQHKGE